MLSEMANFGDAVAHAIEHESGVAGHPPRLIDEPVSGITAMVDGIAVGFECAIGEPVVAHELTIWKIFVDYDRNLARFVNSVCVQFPELFSRRLGQPLLQVNLTGDIRHAIL